MVNVRKFMDYSQIEKDLSSNEEFFVIPDIHGDSEGLLMITSALENLGVADKQIICLGDYVDRGKYSAGVLEYLMSREYICLKGNHDAMLVDFVKNGDPLSLINDSSMGGTIRGLLSYVGGYGQNIFINGTRLHDLTNLIYGKENEDVTEKVRSKLKNNEMVQWLDDLPLKFETDKYLFVHAGINFENPELTMTDDMIWTRPFEDLGAVRNSSYSKTIIVGHSIRPEITIIQDSDGSNRLIMTDTNNWTKKDYRDIYHTKHGAMRIHSNGDIFVGDVKYYRK